MIAKQDIEVKIFSIKICNIIKWKRHDGQWASGDHRFGIEGVQFNEKTFY
jgi:hypothetical protein